MILIHTPTKNLHTYLFYIASILKKKGAHAPIGFYSHNSLIFKQIAKINRIKIEEN